MDIALSPSAASRVAWIAERQKKPAILRLAVEGGGCSGFQYRFGLADAPEADDVIVETDGVRLVVDTMSLDLVRGATVDFVENLRRGLQGGESAGGLGLRLRRQLLGLNRIFRILKLPFALSPSTSLRTCLSKGRPSF